MSMTAKLEIFPVMAAIFAFGYVFHHALISLFVGSTF
jgi:hypothetical protein